MGISPKDAQAWLWELFETGALVRFACAARANIQALAITFVPGPNGHVLVEVHNALKFSEDAITIAGGRAIAGLNLPVPEQFGVTQHNPQN